MLKFSKELQVGVLTALALFLLYFGFSYLKGTNILLNNSLFYIIYDRIEGLDISNSVTINGLKVGRVEKIKLLQDQNDKILVTIEIDKNILIPLNSKAILTDAGLLGDKIIEIKLSDQKQYHSGFDTLAGMKAKNLTDMVKSRASPLLRHLDSTIVGANTAIKVFADQKNNIAELMTNLLTLTSQLNQTVRGLDKNMGQILKQTQTVIKNLEQASGKIPQLVSNLHNLSDSLKVIPIVSISNDLQKSLANLNQISTNLKNGRGSLGLLLNNDSLYHNLNTLVIDIDKLMVDFKARPKRYVHFSVFGKKDKSTRK